MQRGPRSHRKRRHRPASTPILPSHLRSGIPPPSPHTRQNTPANEKAKKQSRGAFGSTTERFSVAGTSPRSRKPGTCIASAYKCSEEDARRGPGCYNTPVDLLASTAKQTTYRFRGSEWSHQQGSPMKVHVGSTSLQLTLRKQKQAHAQSLGPGTYTVKEVHNYGKIPHTLTQSQKRFQDPEPSNASLPGPGLFTDAVERQEKYLARCRTPSSKSVMDRTGRNSRSQKLEETGLSPNLYAVGTAPLVKPSTGKKSAFHSDLPRFIESRSDRPMSPTRYGVTDNANRSDYRRPTSQAFSRLNRNSHRGTRQDVAAVETYEHIGPGHYQSAALLSSTYPPRNGAYSFPKAEKITHFDKLIRQKMTQQHAPNTLSAEPLSDTVRKNRAKGLVRRTFMPSEMRAQPTLHQGPHHTTTVA